MKQQIKYLTIITLLFSSYAINAQTLNGNINLTSQEEVDAFNYTVVTGELRIYDDSGDGTPITNLNGLSELTRVNFRININNCDSLTSLNGLENVTRADYVYIENNESLTDVSGLSSLNYSDHCVIIQNNPKLEEINGFGSLTSVNGYIYIKRCDKLKTISGFNQLQTLHTLEITYCPLLENIIGFSTLQSINSLFIWRNNLLTNINGLSSLENVGSISIEENNLLQSFCNFYQLFSTDGVSGSCTIEDNAQNPTPEEIIASCGTSSVPSITEQEIAIYPNPANDMITISCPQFIKAEVFTASGSSILSSVAPEIYIQSLKPGIYMVKVKSERGIYTLKFIKQ